MSEEFTEEYENQIINEEYKVWKKNAPFIYDMVVTHELDWPSLTVQWLPQKDVVQQEGYAIHKLLLGTHTANQESNYLMIAKVRLPLEETVVDPTEFKQNQKEVGGAGIATGENKVDIEVRILHDKEINRARYMPQKPNIIATKCTSGEVHIFDYMKHPAKPANDQVSPQLRLVGHAKEGYGLSWNPKREGHLLSAGYDNRICYWDIAKATELNSEVRALHEIDFHKSNVEDVCWHAFNENIFASSSDDRHVAIWDLRQKVETPTYNILAHTGEVYSVDFNPFNEYLFLTASEDKTIGLWDLRNTTKRLHTFEGHGDHVIKAEWSPFNMAVFASASQDRRVIVWDLSKCGAEIKQEDEQDGPPEMLFVHGGHRARVNDFSWNVNDQLVVASVEDNNILQIWQMASNIYEEDDGDQMRQQLQHV